MVNLRPVVSAIQTRKPVPSVAVEVVTAVARRVGADETALPPISEVVDPDALDRLFARASGGSTNGPVRVGFEYCGYWIVVEGDRTVSIERTGGTTEATEASGDAA